MHFDLFTTISPTLQPLASDREVPTAEPLRISPWLAMSAMQKGIRRGDVDLALRAAATLLKSDPAKLWRRLCGVVYEDVSIGSVETVKLVMSAATAGKGFRQQFGGEWAVASFLVEQMTISPKDRATDDLLWTIAQHHELEELRVSLAGVDLPEHLSRIRERGALLGASLAALYASGVRWNGNTGKAADPKALFDAMREAGANHEIVALAEQGFRRTREALPVLLPLLTLALPSGELPAVDDDLPPVVIGRNGIPTYCLDGFSHEGKAALARFLRRDLPTSRWLRRHVAAERRLAVLAGAIFRVEGGLVRQRVQWPCALTLRWLADSGFHNMKLSDPAGFLDLVRGDLPAIDEERTNVR